MTEFERFAKGLALTESADREGAFGDPKDKTGAAQVGTALAWITAMGAEFMACGRWQMHPAWYAEWADPAVEVGWSWNQAFEAALGRFWNHYKETKLAIHIVAMVFHLGLKAVQEGGWDNKYAYRFQGFWDALTEENEA